MYGNFSGNVKADPGGASPMRTPYARFLKRLPTASLATARLLALLLLACHIPVFAAESKVETVTHGPVTVTLTAIPGAVFLEQDVMLTIRTTSPEHVAVEIPAINDRLLGFLDAGSFDQEPQIHNSQVTRERVIRLTPLIADEYRIAPMAITYTDGNGGHTESQWFATPPIALSRQAITDHEVGDDIKDHFKPVWIYPPMRTVAGYIAILLAAAAIAIIVWKLIRRAHRKIRLMRMSPRERALEELQELLDKKLIEKEQLKDFYVELTMVVRRYIERQHHIRAPEQTTEEFLAAIANNPHFDADVVLRLQRFLQAADLVKFAAYQPGQTNINAAIDTAKDYITSDADQTEATEGIATVTEHKERLL
jgi:hypothetical protein